ncbi:MAG TPA: response regulator, partial [Terriglobales bacterium]|nr:response regulator [Terriglobales bacterium]
EHRSLLFVDDEPNIRATLPLILAQHRFDVRAAANLHQALEAIHGSRFDLLLCDLNIERECDGFNVVDAFREANPGSITLILTGYPGFESAVEAIQHHVDDYISKPVEVETLLANLNRRLAQRKPKAHILSVSYDQPLLLTRHMLLEREGYKVHSVAGFESGMQACKQGRFDLFILGHSIPFTDKRKLVKAFRESCPAPVISLRRNAGEQVVDGAEFHVEPDPEPLLKQVREIVNLKVARPGSN